jgi:hypothetical protein
VLKAEIWAKGDAFVRIAGRALDGNADGSLADRFLNESAYAGRKIRFGAYGEDAASWPS